MSFDEDWDEEYSEKQQKSLFEAVDVYINLEKKKNGKRK